MAYIQSNKGQPWLLPPTIEELIPADHICYLVEGLADSLDYTAFDIKYSGAGHPAYHPRILTKLLIMGVLDRVRSSRRLSRNARENVVYMYLSEKLTPDFRTISDFRKDNPELVKEVFKQTVSFAREEGLLDLSHLSTDGTKIKANASNRSVFTEGELGVLMRFVDEELAEWASTDEREDVEFGELRGSDQMPKQSKNKIQKAAKDYIKKVQARGLVGKEEIKESLGEAKKEAEERGVSKVSMTDPGSRFMKNKKGRIELSYNPQLTVDKGGFVVASDVCQDIIDNKQLQPQVLQTEENLGGLPENVKWSFDAGYYQGENIKFLVDKKVDGYIPDCNEEKLAGAYDKKSFRYDEYRDAFICPENHTVNFLGEHFDKQKKKTIRIYKGVACAGCQSREKCTKQKDGVRYLKVFPWEAERNAMAEKMKTEKGQEIYKLRRQTVEPAIGDIKENKGLRSFLARGLTGARIEFNLACAARNLGKIWRYFREKGDGRGKFVESGISKSPFSTPCWYCYAF